MNHDERPFQQSIQSFLDAASSSSPTPGGGSVAALVAALGASMASMVAGLTRGTKFAHVDAKMAELVGKMQSSMNQFEQLLISDVNSFNAYMAALKLPKSTVQEITIRRTSIQEAIVSATEVPLELARECLSALTATRGSAEEANKQVLSDLGIAAMLLDTAGHSALLTADINIPSIKDEGSREEFIKRRDDLDTRLSSMREETVHIVRRRMNQK